jgi:hypothetical protein
MKWIWLHSSRIFRAAPGLLLGVVLVAVPKHVLAQSSTSAINGVVIDSSQSAVAGTKVTLKNVDTNAARTTVSNGTGDYFFSSVVPARYSLTFVAPGFQTETISIFEVGVAQAVTLNATLKVGEVTETVTVQASGVQVESSTAQLGTVIDEKQVTSLPLDGRNFTQLLTLTPGVNSDQHGPKLQRKQYRCGTWGE